jgi:hypothetical protein
MAEDLAELINNPVALVAVAAVVDVMEVVVALVIPHQQVHRKAVMEAALAVEVAVLGRLVTLQAIRAVMVCSRQLPVHLHTTLAAAVAHSLVKATQFQAV